MRCPPILSGVGILALALLPMNAKGAEHDSQIRALRAENSLLRTALEAKDKEIHALKAQVRSIKDELERLKMALEKAGIDSSAMIGVKLPVDKPEGKDEKPGQDGNTAVAEAVQKYAAAVSASEKQENTDIQRRERWFSATKQLEAALRRSPVTITFTLRDVEVESGKNTAMLSVASAIIKSSDPNVGDLVFREFYNIRIQASAEEAQKLTKTSSVTMRGFLGLGVDLSKPVPEQPVLLGNWDMPGYRPVGTPRGMPSFGWSDAPTIMIREGFTLHVDGVPRKVPAAGYRYRKR